MNFIFFLDELRSEFSIILQKHVLENMSDKYNFLTQICLFITYENVLNINICYLQNKCVDFHINEISTSSFGKKKVSASFTQSKCFMNIRVN